MLMAFPLLMAALAAVIMFLWHWLMLANGPDTALALMQRDFPVVSAGLLVVVGLWFVIAWLLNRVIVDAAMGANVTAVPAADPLYVQLETLCISRGLTMPDFRILETPARNAYASGLGDRDARIVVTRGLIDHLQPDEIEAVLAHELTHIRARDVRTMMIAIVFVGILALVLEILARGIFRSSFSRASRHRRSGGNNAALFLVLAMVALALAYLLAKMLKFAISRSREYAADAGAVELTKNPDAMVRALQAISGHAEMAHAAPDAREVLFFDPAKGLAGLFSTHPPIDRRIAALARFAGAQL
jgi:heat shock protein HtpX